MSREENPVDIITCRKKTRNLVIHKRGKHDM